MKAKLILESLNEYMEINKEGSIKGNVTYGFEDMIEVIDRTKGTEFSAEDFRDFLDFLIEIKMGASNDINLIKYLFNMHPEMQEDIINGEGPFKEILDAYIELIEDKLGQSDKPNPDQAGMGYRERYN